MNSAKITTQSSREAAVDLAIDRITDPSLRSALAARSAMVGSGRELLRAVFLRTGYQSDEPWRNLIALVGQDAADRLAAAVSDGMSR